MAGRMFTQGANISNSGTFDPAFLAVGDFNDDGKTDLAIASLSNNVILLGNGDGTFSVSPTAPISNAASSIAVADLNGMARPVLLSELNMDMGQAHSSRS